MAAAPDRSAGGSALAAAILDTGLALAGERGWQAVRLHDVAARLDLPPDRILDHYRDLDAVANAWFERGLRAMLAPRPPGFAELPADRRVEACLLAWFDALAPHRRVTVQMLRGKLHPSHPHHWVPMVFDLSRTIHWLREAALLPAVYGSGRAQLEEVGLTVLFTATLWTWARDDSPGQQRTRRALRRRLACADTLLARIGRRRPRRDSAAVLR